MSGERDKTSKINAPLSPRKSSSIQLRHRIFFLLEGLEDLDPFYADTGKGKLTVSMAYRRQPRDQMSEGVPGTRPSRISGAR